MTLRDSVPVTTGTSLQDTVKQPWSLHAPPLPPKGTRHYATGRTRYYRTDKTLHSMTIQGTKSKNMTRHHIKQRKTLHCRIACLLVGCLMSQQHASVSTDGSAQTSFPATPRQKLRIKRSTSPSHSILTPSRPVPALTYIAGRLAG